MNIFKHCFEELTEEDVDLLKSYFDGFDYRGAGYTFLANYIWRNTHCLCWEVIGDYLVMAGADCMTRDPSAIISMPLTKNGNYDPKELRKTLLEAKRRFDERKIPFSIELVASHMVHFLREAFPEELKVVRNRDSDEYVYLKEKLISFSGRALHKKKNHLNYFLKTYEYEVKPITLDMTSEIMSFVAKLREGKSYEREELESLRMEEEAIKEILRFVEEPRVYSAAIFIDGKLEAFSIGERLSQDTAVAHFEKANDGFRGLYQVICREFCRLLPEEIVYVNREEDMGLENLRKAKEALRPHHMEERYSVGFSREIF